MRYAILLLTGVAACTTEPTAPTTPPATDLPLIRGYRAPADQCQLVGESAQTVDYLDHTSDLVACPTDYEGLGVFVIETGAVPIEDIGQYTLYSVPTG